MCAGPTFDQHGDGMLMCFIDVAAMPVLCCLIRWLTDANRERRRPRTTGVDDRRPGLAKSLVALIYRIGPEDVGHNSVVGVAALVPLTKYGHHAIGTKKCSQHAAPMMQMCSRMRRSEGLNRGEGVHFNAPQRSGGDRSGNLYIRRPACRRRHK